MPAITRSQRKTMQSVQVSNPDVNVNANYEIKKEQFIIKCKELITDCQKIIGNQNKAKVCIQVYDLINNELSELFQHDKYTWLPFIASTFNKIMDLQKEIDKYHDKISFKLRTTLYIKLFQAKKITLEILKQHSDLRIHPQIDIAVKNIKKMEAARPRRNIQRINYAEMDMNENDKGDVSVCKKWFENGKMTYKIEKYPLSQINEIGDEDYNFEESDNEDELENNDLKLNSSEKQKIKQEIAQLDYNTKLRHKVVPDYSGMDMNEDDQGDFKICKKMMDDGKLIHYWVSVPLSQINDYDDEDYIYEK